MSFFSKLYTNFKKAPAKAMNIRLSAESDMLTIKSGCVSKELSIKISETDKKSTFTVINATNAYAKHLLNNLESKRSIDDAATVDSIMQISELILKKIF